MGVEKSAYCSYLLRLWRDGAMSPWRASLETPGQAATEAFPNLEALFAFLRTQTSQDQVFSEQQTEPPGQREE